MSESTTSSYSSEFGILDLSESAAPPVVARRPSVMSLNIKEKAALYASWMPYFTNGGMFVPTTRDVAMGEEVYLVLSLLDDAAKYPVSGKVAWITPANAANKKVQGIGVHFNADESSVLARSKIEGILGAAIKSSRTTHSL